MRPITAYIKAIIGYFSALVGLLAGAFLLLLFLLIDLHWPRKASNSLPEGVFFAIPDYKANSEAYLSLREDQKLQVRRGEGLFANNCQICHAMTDEYVVGPGLYGIEQRRSKDWVRKWIRNPQQILESGGSYAVSLVEKFSPTIMSGFPQLSESEMEALLAYISRGAYLIESDKSDSSAVKAIKPL